MVDVGGSPTAANSDASLRAALRAPSGCKSLPVTVGVPGKTVSHEMVLVVALREAALTTPELRGVHAPAWLNDGEATEATMAKLVGAWGGQLTVVGLEGALDCAAGSEALDETRQVCTLFLSLLCPFLSLMPSCPRPPPHISSPPPRLSFCAAVAGDGFGRRRPRGAQGLGGGAVRWRVRWRRLACEKKAFVRIWALRTADQIRPPRPAAASCPRPRRRRAG
jgi:hypothetical protein